MGGSGAQINTAASGQSQLKQTQSQNNLPPLKETNKFSSWADKNLFDQVDELLFEQENNTPSQASQNQKLKQGNIQFLKDINGGRDSATAQNQLNTSGNKESLLSLSGSLVDLDSDEIEDEIKNLSQRSQSNKQIERSNTGSGEINEPVITDSLDLDNSDDLNKIISRYENLLGQEKDSNQSSENKLRESQSSQSSLEESWGSNQFSNGDEKTKKQAKKTEKKKSMEEDNYDDDFEQHEEDEYNEDEDNHLVDEEIYLNSSIGKKDSDFLKELLSQPIRTKQNSQEQQKKQQEKAVPKNSDTQDSESSGEYQDEIDEFIKKHIEAEENEEKEERKLNSIKKEAVNLSSGSQFSNATTTSDNGSDSPISDETEKKSPKQVLLEELKKLSDVFGKYSLTDREMFLSDFDAILKILTYEEVKQCILPCLEIYANEQEFLKLQFFQKLPSLFKKLLKYPGNKNDAFGVFEFQLFPLIAKMLSNSEEQVQTEGVEALLTISKDTLKADEAQAQIFQLIEIIIEKADSNESAKIAVLLLVEKFTEASILSEGQCLAFINQHLNTISKGMLFKIKKFLLPTLLSISKHLPYEVFEKHVYSTFVKFTQDDIWGVRKVCLEKLQDFIKLIKSDEVSKFSFCLQFLQSSLNDSSRWVKNQAFSQFGYILNEVKVKLDQSSKSQSEIQVVKELMNQCFDTFYDQKFISGGEEDQICQSFMNNQNDDVDKVKHNWAFFISCALLINGGQQYWEQRLKAVYMKLFKDILINVRKSLASSIVEVMKLVDMNMQENQTFFTDVFTTYLNDIDEVKQRILPKLCQIIALYPKDQHNHLLSTLIREQLENESCKKRDTKIELLEQIYSLFQPTFLAEQEFHVHLIDIINKETFIQFRKRACKVIGSKVIAPLIKSKKYRKTLTTFIDELRASKNFRTRQMYLFIAQATFEQDQEIFKKHFAKAIGNDMLEEKVKVVQIQLAKLCLDVPDSYSKSVDKVRQTLREKVRSPDVLQYMTRELYQSHSELVDKESTNIEEEQKEETETQEIEAAEKTAQIRFANFTTLQRNANGGGLGDIGSLFSSSLMALLGGYLSQSALGKGSDEMIDRSEEALLGKATTTSPWQS